MQEHCQKPAGSVFMRIFLTILRFSIHLPAVAVGKEPQTGSLSQGETELKGPTVLATVGGPLANTQKKSWEMIVNQARRQDFAAEGAKNYTRGPHF